MHRLALLATAAWLAFSPTPGAAENRAILIGIDAYPFRPPESQLRAPVADVRAMRDFLIGADWFSENEIVTMLNSAATADRIARVITMAAEASDPGDRLLIYFSGHGSRVRDRNGDEADGYDEVLVAHDFGAPDDQAGNRKLPGIVPDDFMAKVLGDLDDRDVTVIVDACHSATSTRDAALPDPEADVARGLFYEASRGVQWNVTQSAREASYAEGRRPTQKVWAAAAAEQFSWEGGGRGVFTDLFIRGLRDRKADANGNGIITSAELLDYTRAGAKAWCAASAKCTRANKGFTPNFEGPVDTVVLRYSLDGALPDATAQGAYPLPVKTVVENPQRPTPAPAPMPPVIAPDKVAVAIADLAQPQPVAAAAPEPAASPAITAQDSHRPLALADLLGQGNDAGLTLTISGGPDLTLGQSVQFELTTNRSGTLVVFDVNPRGELLQLSPSVISRENVERVAAGDVVHVPEGLSANGHPIMMDVTEPTGVGQLVALLIEDDGLDIETLLGGHLTGEPIANARSLLTELAERLRRMQAEEGVNRPVAWSSTYQTYTIQP